MKHKVTVKEVNITKEYADELLSNLPDGQSRRLRMGHVKKLARIMEQGEWQDMNGDTIVIDSDGFLIDGNHRLKAVILSKSCIVTLLVTGVTPKAFFSIDQQGKPRGTADILRIEGHTNCAVKAAATKCLYIYKCGLTPPKANSNQTPTVKQVAKLHNLNADAMELSAKCGIKAKKIIAAGLGTFLHFIFAEKNRSKADIFFTRLASGANICPGSPIQFLRDRLIFDKSSTKKLYPTEKLALAIIAWNHWKTEKPMVNLRWRKDRDGNRTFPDVA